MVALSPSSFALLRVGRAASIHADLRGEKALGFWGPKRGMIGRRWRCWSKWSKALGDDLRECTKGRDWEERVVPGGPPVFEKAMVDFLEGAEWADGRWHGHRRGGGAAAFGLIVGKA